MAPTNSVATADPLVEGAALGASPGLVLGGQEPTSSSSAGYPGSCSSGTVDPFAALLAPAFRFPGAALVSATVALFPRDVLPSGLLQGGREGRDFLVAVGPGTVGVRLVDGERRSRTEATDRGRGRETSHGDNLSDLLAGADLLGDLVDRTTAWTAERESLAEVGRSLRPVVEDLEPGEGRSRLIVEWTAKSRRSMTRALAELDYAPMFAGHASPAMVTLTYPGDWLTVAPGGSVVKGHLRALMRRWARSWHVCTSACVTLPAKGRADRGAPRKGRAPSTGVRWVTRHAYALPVHLWKQEFQRRGAPHLHLFAVPPHGEALCSCCGVKLVFTHWLSHAWAAVVAHPDPEQRRRHRLAGTGVDYAEGAKAKDPKRLAVYFTKHGGAAGGKEYQHRVPSAWLRDAHGLVPGDEDYGFPVDGPGRFWGYSGLERVCREVYVTRDRYVATRRTLRRLAASKGLTRTRRVPRVDTRTGVVRARTVTRRTGYLTHGGLAGGWLCVNDGPAFGSALVRLGEAGVSHRDGLGAALRAWDANPVPSQGPRAGGVSVSGSA